MTRATIQRIATPTGILVGLPDELATYIIDVLGDRGLRVLKVGHVAAAAERIPVVMPQVVIISTTFRAEELEMLNDRCVAVGAEVIRIAPDADTKELAPILKTAATHAMIRALQSS